MPLDPHAAALGLLLRSGPNMLELNWLLAKGYSPHEALTKLLNGFGRPRELLTDRETAEVAKFERELARSDGRANGSAKAEQRHEYPERQTPLVPRQHSVGRQHLPDHLCVARSLR